MELYDIVMLVIVAGAVFFGFLKGFAWQIASLLSLVASYFLALRFADSLAPQISSDPRIAKYLAMLVIYCGTSLAVWLGFRVVSGAISRIQLREFDRQMGGLFGLAKGALICTIITFFAVTLSEQSRAAVLRSKSGVYIARFLHAATPVMPPEVTEMLGPYIDKLDRGLDPNQSIDHPQLPNLPLPNGQNGPGMQMPTYDQMQQQYQQLQQYVPGGQQYAPAPSPYGQAPQYAPGTAVPQTNPYNQGYYPNGAPVNR
jgi:membrane protein required for colicin V production